MTALCRKDNEWVKLLNIFKLLYYKLSYAEYSIQRQLTGYSRGSIGGRSATDMQGIQIIHTFTVCVYVCEKTQFFWSARSVNISLIFVVIHSEGKHTGQAARTSARFVLCCYLHTANHPEITTEAGSLQSG